MWSPPKSAGAHVSSSLRIREGYGKASLFQGLWLRHEVNHHGVPLVSARDALHHLEYRQLCRQATARHLLLSHEPAGTHISFALTGFEHLSAGTMCTCIDKRAPKQIDSPQSHNHNQGALSRLWNGTRRAECSPSGTQILRRYSDRSIAGHCFPCPHESRASLSQCSVQVGRLTHFQILWAVAEGYRPHAAVD